MFSHVYSSTLSHHSYLSSFFFNDPPTTEIYTLSLHDALPISLRGSSISTRTVSSSPASHRRPSSAPKGSPSSRSEEHTSELQSRGHLVCRLLLEKKKKKITNTISNKNMIHKRYYTASHQSSLK